MVARRFSTAVEMKYWDRQRSAGMKNDSSVVVRITCERVGGCGADLNEVKGAIVARFQVNVVNVQLHRVMFAHADVPNAVRTVRVRIRVIW